jgi:hypothetical protein
MHTRLPSEKPGGGLQPAEVLWYVPGRPARIAEVLLIHNVVKCLYLTERWVTPSVPGGYSGWLPINMETSESLVIDGI